LEVRFTSNEELICVAAPLQHFFFVNRIAEQVVGIVGSDSCSYVPCDVGLFHYLIIWSLHNTTLGSWEDKGLEPLTDGCQRSTKQVL
jgi:hypothetical protein